MSASQAFSETCDSIQSIILIISKRLIPAGLSQTSKPRSSMSPIQANLPRKKKVTSNYTIINVKKR